MEDWDYAELAEEMEKLEKAFEKQKKEIQNLKNENSKLRQENNDIYEKLKTSIPRRRVRRIYNMTKKILEEDISSENHAYLNYLKVVVTKYRNKEKVKLDEPLVTAIEHCIGLVEIHGDDDDNR